VKYLAAPPTWRAIDFVSDLHLSADHPRTFDAWRAFMAGSDADAVFILGDLFEVWVGDDARNGEFESACVDVLAQAARRLQVAFMHGNRDFLVGPEMLRASHMSLLADPTLLDAWGRCVVLTHGDALCLDDTDYQRFRAEVRGTAWQQSFLSRPLEQRQAIARSMRDASALAQRGRTSWADVDPTAAVTLMRDNSSVDMVHGHTHRPGDSELAPGFARHVLTDWDLDDGPPRAEVLRLTRDGFARHRPDALP
jgi:UDP-2,3-diacylglucosamine hydrolase